MNLFVRCEGNKLILFLLTFESLEMTEFHVLQTRRKLIMSAPSECLKNTSKISTGNIGDEFWTVLRISNDKWKTLVSFSKSTCALQSTRAMTTALSKIRSKFRAVVSDHFFQMAPLPWDMWKGVPRKTVAR